MDDSSFWQTLFTLIQQLVLLFGKAFQAIQGWISGLDINLKQVLSVLGKSLIWMLEIFISFIEWVLGIFGVV